MYQQFGEQGIEGRTEKPSVSGLIDLLEHPDRWPDHFKWDFTCRYNCAMGLMTYVWGVIPRAEHCARALNITAQDAARIFLATGRNMINAEWAAISATDVAALLRELLPA